MFLCIPRAMNYTTTADVERVFNKLFEGEFVERVDERGMTDSYGQDFKMFYIHFYPDMTSLEMENFKQKMEEDGMVQVMTGKGTWFWKVYLNKSEKKVPVRTGPRIMTEEDEQLFLQWKETRNRAAAEEKKEEAPPMFLLEEEEEEFTQEELDELTVAYIEMEQEELMSIADKMYADSLQVPGEYKKPTSYASALMTSCF